MNSSGSRSAFIGALLGVASVSAASGFYFGQRTERSSSYHAQVSEAQPTQQLLHRKLITPETLNLESVVIQRVATIGFAELYDLMEAASPDLRARWLKRIQKMPEGIERTAALTTYYKVLIQLDPAAATDSLIHPDRRSDRLLAIPLMTGAALPSALPDVVRALLAVPRDDVWRGHGPDYLGDAIRQWSWGDPVAVSRFLEEHRGEDIADYADGLMSNWAAIDPAAAKIWLDRYDPQHKIQNAIGSWLDGWFANDRDAAVNYVVAHAQEEQVQDALWRYTYGLFIDSPEIAHAFIQRLPDAETQKRAIQHLGASGDEPASDAVAKWLITFPKEVWKDDIGSVLSKWEDRDAQTLVAWMSQLPSEMHDPVVAQYCSSEEWDRHTEEEENSDTISTQVERRMAMAMTISDSATREAILRELVRTTGWRRSPAEFAQMLGKTSLSDLTKSHLISLLPEK